MKFRQHKTAAFLLALLLTAALAAQGCSYRRQSGGTSDDPATVATPSPTEAAATPSPTGDGTELSAEETLNRVLVSYRTDAQDYFTDDGAVKVLVYSCRTPQVTIPGREDAESAVNKALAALTDEYVAGHDEEGGATDSLQGMLADAKSFYAQVTEAGNADTWTPYAKDRDVTVGRGDAAVLSFLYDDYSNTGGVHGYTTRTGVSFDAETGARLTLADLAADADALRQLCIKTILDLAAGDDYKQYGLNEGYEDTIPQLVADGYWYFSDRGLVFVANPYDIASYAAGRIEFTVTYKTLTGVLEDRYMPLSRSGVQGGLSGALASDKDLTGLTPLLEADPGGDVGTVFVLWADNSVYNVRLAEAVYVESSGGFEYGKQYLYASRMDDGEFLRVTAVLPDTIPNLMVTWKLPDGTTQICLISQSGKDGSLLLIDPDTLSLLPADVTASLPYSADLDNDGEDETVDLTGGGDGAQTRTLSVTDGDETYTDETGLSAASLWLADLDGSGGWEIYLSGTDASGGAYTRGWQLLGGLQSLRFSGIGADSADDSRALGRIVSAGDGLLTLEAELRVLGAYSGQLTYSMGGGGVLSPADGSLWTLSGNTSMLKTALDLPVTLDEGGEAALPAGTELCVTATDGASKVLFTTADGRSGSIALTRGADNGWLIAGRAEADYFESLPYAV